MGIALDEARRAGSAGEVPVGAVVLVDDVVVARDHNRREETSDPSAHAELLALRAACAGAGAWRLPGATVVVTLEPCPMCAGALVAARVGRVVFGAADPKAGALGSLYNLATDPRLPHEFARDSGGPSRRMRRGAGRVLRRASLTPSRSVRPEDPFASVVRPRRDARADEWDGLENR